MRGLCSGLSSLNELSPSSVVTSLGTAHTWASQQVRLQADARCPPGLGNQEGAVFPEPREVLKLIEVGPAWLSTTKGSTDMRDSNQDPGRRSVLRGAAWTVPIIAATAAVPLAVASTCSRTTRTFETPGLATTFTVPAGAPYVDFVVRGAGGGAGTGLAQGQGAESTGRITLPSNATVAQRTFGLVVGQGGEVKTDGTTAFGGAGYGVGGSSTYGPRNNPSSPAGGGGGGSALLVGALGGAPLIVSGGGGGVAVRQVVQGVTRQVTVYSEPDATTGFAYGRSNAGSDAPNGRVGAVGRASGSETGLAVSPAIAANGATGGARAGTSHYVLSNGDWGPVTRVEGLNGQNHGLGARGGGNGGDGAQRLDNGNGSFGASAGGGGGGYAGGGGGGMVGSRFTGTNTLSISSGTGAAGSSYRPSTDAAAALGYAISGYTLASSGLNSNTNRGHEGYVSLSWCV